MNRFIVNTTAANPLGLPTGRKCFRVKSGQFANRLVILYSASAATIALVWADPPYSSFSAPINIITDSADKPFDAFMTDDGDIYIAYTVAGAFNLGFSKLTFDGGTWSIGTPVTVYNLDENYFPVIQRLSSGYLWIAYTRVSGDSHYISAKSSSDDGLSWGTVSNPGDTLTSGSTKAYAAMVEASGYQYIFYNDNGSKIAYRRKLNNGIIWNSEIILASGNDCDDNLAAAIDSDGKIGVAFALSSGLKFREYSGSTWSGEYTIDDNPVSGPVVSYQGGVPYILFNRSYGDGMNLVLYTSRVGTVFHNPVILDGRKAYLQKLLLYDASAGTYQDKTGEAASPDSADIYHTGSGALISATGDTLFIGLEEPFHFVRLILSTVGTGGEVVWKYWDGQAWIAFTPFSGAWHLTTTPHDLLLWSDFLSIPADWQKKSISAHHLFWISASVTSTFTNAPIGSRMSTISNLKALSAQV